MKRTLLLMAAIGIFSAVSAISGEDAQVSICHFPPGNPANVQILVVGQSAALAHIQNHEGDKYYLGTCDSQTSWSW